MGPGGGCGGLALQKAQRAGTALAGRMEQTAAHAGMQGANPYCPAGRDAALRLRVRPGYRQPADGAGQVQEQDPGPRPARNRHRAARTYLPLDPPHR